MKTISQKVPLAWLKCLVFSVILIAAADWPAAAQVTLVPAGSEWRYLDNGVNLGPNWRSLNFDDSSWKSGRGQLGYGDGDEMTVISYGSDPTNKYPTYYF